MYKRFQTFPVEREHRCEEKEKCFIVGNKCFEYNRVIFPSHLKEIITSDFSILSCTPQLVNPKYFFIKVDFPTTVPLIKLININNRSITIKKVLQEFLLFLKEIYAVEDLTIGEEKFVLECSQCTTEEFKHFEKRNETVQCSICSEEIGAQIVLSCGHSFDEKCLSKWFKEKNTCPLCRRPIIPCACQGKREIDISVKPSILNFIEMGTDSTGIYKLKPYAIEEILYTAIIYDSESNVFEMRFLDVFG